MKIRIGRKKDRKNYLETQKEAFPKIDSKRDSKFFDSKIRKKEIFVAEEDKRYAGHLCFGKHLLEPPFIGSVFIEELAVKREFRGRGFAKNLVGWLVKYCKERIIKEIYTGTGDYPENKNEAFYKRLGFEKAGNLKNINPTQEYDYGQIFYLLLTKNWKS